MKLPVIEGVIRRRILINYRADPAVIQAMLPEGFSPKLHLGFAMAGVCLIRLEHIRPTGIPAFAGIASENAAHRIAVRWGNGDRSTEGVYIPRRDTSSCLNHLAGGRLFPGEHSLADFAIRDQNGDVHFAMQSRDGLSSIELRGTDGDRLPADSLFTHLPESSEFFKGGCIGYSACQSAPRLDGMRLETLSWEVRPFHVDRVDSSFFADTGRFPAGSVVFDHALIMRNVQCRWHNQAPYPVRQAA